MIYRLQHLLERVDSERLRQEMRPRRKRRPVGIKLPRGQDDRKIRPVLPQQRRDLDPVQIGQRDVEDEHVWIEVPDRIRHFSSKGDRGDMERFRERRGDTPAGSIVVLNEQNSHRQVVIGKGELLPSPRHPPGGRLAAGGPTHPASWMGGGPPAARRPLPALTGGWRTLRYPPGPQRGAGGGGGHPWPV